MSPLRARGPLRPNGIGTVVPPGTPPRRASRETRPCPAILARRSSRQPRPTLHVKHQGARIPDGPAAARVLRYARLRRATQDEGEGLGRPPPILILSSGEAAYRRTGAASRPTLHVKHGRARVPGGPVAARVLRYARLRRATQDEGEGLGGPPPILILSSGEAAYRRTGAASRPTLHVKHGRARIPGGPVAARVLRYARLRRATQDEGDGLGRPPPILILSSGEAAYRSLILSSPRRGRIEGRPPQYREKLCPSFTMHSIRKGAPASVTAMPRSSAGTKASGVSTRAAATPSPSATLA